MKILSLIELVFLLILLASCDPGSITTTSIKNDTKGPLDVVLYSANQGEVKARSLSAESKKKIDIFNDWSMGVIKDAFPQDLGIDSICFDFPGILNITFKEGDPGKNPFKKDDWIQTIKTKYRTRIIVTIIFEISEEDLSSWQ